MKDRTVTLRIVETELPEEVHGVSAQTKDGFIIFLDERMTEDQRTASFLHECLHIYHEDHGEDLRSGTLETVRRAEMKRLLLTMI